MITQQPSPSNPDAQSETVNPQTQQAEMGKVDKAGSAAIAKSGAVSSRPANNIERINRTPSAGAQGGMAGEG